MPNLPKLAIVVPCYNEEAVLMETAKQLAAKLNSLINNAKVNPTSFILFIDDGSKDHTWDMITALQEQHTYFKGVIRLK